MVHSVEAIFIVESNSGKLPPLSVCQRKLVGTFFDFKGENVKFNKPEIYGNRKH